MKLGKLPAIRPHGLSDLAVYAKSKLPSPPTAVNVPAVEDWGILGNDQYGDCTIAGAAHLIMAADARVAENDIAPSAQETVNQYFALTGGQDTGCVEADVLQRWMSDGLFAFDTNNACVPANKIAGYAPVDPRDLTAVHQAIAFYQCYIGVALPSSAQQQFSAGQPWTAVPGSPIEGGHCIVPVGYSPQYVYCVTWGAIAAVSYPWWAQYVDEVWAVIPQAYVEAGHGPALDVASLQADLRSL